MRIIVTGATGFVGQNLVPSLLRRGHSVVAVARRRATARRFEWYEQIEFVPCDVHSWSDDTINRLAAADAVIHLAWPNLPNYGELFHIEENYPAAYCFLKALIQAGIKQVMVAGTCFEYGLQNGCLVEDAPTVPVNPYGMGKDFLRRSLEALSRHVDFRLQWARLFYMYGPGQSSNSLLAQLDAAIARGDRSINMSQGEQIRDYTSIQTVAEYLADIVQRRHWDGVVNICSGTPISIRELVESRLEAAHASLDLNLGYHPYSPHEPFAFWGSRKKLDAILT